MEQGSAIDADRARILRPRTRNTVAARTRHDPVPTPDLPWGLVVNEAFNQAVPVVASDCVGAAAGGLLRDNVNGFVVPERNAEALGDALNRVLNSAQIHRRLGFNARRTIDEWTTERMVSGFSAAIEHACAR